MEDRGGKGQVERMKMGGAVAINSSKSHRGEEGVEYNLMKGKVHSTHTENPGHKKTRIENVGE